MPTFERIVEGALQRLGRGMKESILYHYYKFQPASPSGSIEPEKFHVFLHEVFGQGSFVIEDIIVKYADSAEFNIQDEGSLLTVRNIFTCCDQ